MRKTKLICTIGPASDSYEMISKLCDEGMNVARINFSHGNHSEHKTTMDKIKEVRDKKIFLFQSYLIRRDRSVVLAS